MREPVKVGVLGTARVVELALLNDALQTPEIKVVAIASRNACRAEAYAKKHGIERHYGQYEDLLSDHDVELVYIPVPNSLHAPWCIRAMQAGKAVLCEKPIAANAAQAKAVLEASHRVSWPIIEALHYRHHPLMKFVRNLISEERLGPLRSLEAGMNISAAHFESGDIRFNAALGGGATMDVGVYCVDLLRLVANCEPEVVSAKAGLASACIDGAMQVELRFGHVPARIECSLQHSSTQLWLTAEGERGRIHIDNPFVPQWGHMVTLTIDHVTEQIHFDNTSSHIFQARHVAAVIRDAVAIDSDALNGVRNMMVVDDIYRAAGMSPRQ